MIAVHYTMKLPGHLGTAKFLQKGRGFSTYPIRFAVNGLAHSLTMSTTESLPEKAEILMLNCSSKDDDFSEKQSVPSGIS